MKQGRADRSGPTGQKVEPRSKGVNPGAVSYLGNKLGNHVMEDGIVDRDGGATPWSSGPGYNSPPYRTSTDGNAPGAGMKTRRGGSQGKY